MKKIVALTLALVMVFAMAACGAAPKTEEPTPTPQPEEKKALPVAVETEPSATEAPLYKDIMKPYSDIEHGKRLIILQNTLQFSRAGVFTEEETPVAETVSFNGADYNGYPMAAATRHLTLPLEGDVTVYTTADEVVTVSAADFESATVLVDDFQSGNSPLLLLANGTAVESFDYAVMASGEGIFSIISEQEVNLMDLFADYGWDNTLTYNVVATDVFYIPVTPEDYDEGGLRGALSGAINASFVDMIIATGKLNDVVFIEQIVE